ncbi:MAG: DUF1987 domain-containing protein [Microscillaceae bacterium]|nr:DUF1987 domain-containing protein [Microscillaceae bacterium]MDW8460996.1 DUF1987 domain-containing protein [Cytophagales bacterium]
MENISIEATTKTPTVILNAQQGLIEIKGVSIPEDAESFYRPLLDWLNEYVATTKLKKTIFSIKLIYFNTSTSDYIVGMMKKLKQLTNKKHEIIVRWYYEEEDEDMRDTGSHFQVIADLPFEFIPSKDIA